MSNRLTKKIVITVVITLIMTILLSGLNYPIKVADCNPQTVQIKSYSSLKKNTLDVLVLGSCQAYQGFNTAELWKQYGLTSYVLASPDQRMYTSYYYLKYALKTQTPKVLLLESLFLAESNEYNKPYDQIAIFSMDLSKERFLLSDLSFNIGYQGQTNTVDYYAKRFENIVGTALPILSFHARNDYSVSEIKYLISSITSREKLATFRYGNGGVYNGSVPMYCIKDLSVTYADYMENKNDSVEIDKDTEIYFKKIIELCEANNIKLVLFKTASPRYWNFAKSVAVEKYCENLSLPNIDFNIESDNYEFDLSKHFYFDWKLNAEGMKITTDYLGKYLTNHYSFWVDHTGDQEVNNYYNDLYNKYFEVYESAEWEIIDDYRVTPK